MRILIQKSSPPCRVCSISFKLDEVYSTALMGASLPLCALTTLGAFPGLLQHILGWAETWGDAATRQLATLLKHIWALYQAFN